MRVIKVISCALACAFIIFLSCFSVFAAAPPGWEDEVGGKPKNYSQMTEAELLANNQIPIDYIIKTIQKQIDKTVENDDGKEERVFDFLKGTKDENDKILEEPVPVGKFNLVNFLQDKYFILTYEAKGTKPGEISPVNKETVYIPRIYVFERTPFLDCKSVDYTTVPSYDYSEGAVHMGYVLFGKPSYKLSFDTFITVSPYLPTQKFLIRDYEFVTSSSSDGEFTPIRLQHSNCLKNTDVTDGYYSSFYMNFMPEGGDGLLNNFVVTDKDISSEKQYIDDPDRPDGKYEYAVYEFQNDVMTMAQYFEAKPESVIPSKVGSMTNYTIKHFGNSYVWDVKNNKYTEFNAGWVMTTTTNLFKDYPSTNTVVKFSWKPFDDYDGELYEDDALLVDGKGFVTERPIGSYPFVLKRYVNSRLYETFYFRGPPKVVITDLVKSYEKSTMTAKISVSSAGVSTDKNAGVAWYSKKQNVFYVPEKDITALHGQLRETYDIYVHFLPDGTREGNYLTFNWDAGGQTDSYNSWNPFAEKNGDNLDPFFEENDDIITDGEGNLVGQGDGSKPGQNKGDGFEFGDFEFNNDSLWKYATEFLSFCGKTFAVLPSFIWEIFATGAVIVVMLRILGR